MFRIIVFLVAFFSWAALANSGEEPPIKSGAEIKQDITTEEPAKEPAASINKPTKPTGLSNTEKSDIGTNPAHNKGQKKTEPKDRPFGELGERDLVQQTSMAESAGNMNFLTSLGLVFSIVGIILLYHNLKIAIVAADGAKVAANAALIGAKAAQDEVRNNRAWVTCQEKIMPADRPVTRSIPLITIFKNTGGTPAVNVWVDQRYVWSQRGELCDFTPTKSTEPGISAGIVGPNVIGKSHLEFPLDEIRTYERQEAMKCFLYTAIQYETIWGDNCITETVEEIEFHQRTSHDGMSLGYEFNIHTIGPQQKAT